ncbi:MAG: hypothetical protein K1X89_00190 [Myxococcaceae bacterium]|nr:hypothetical protein [Myxococcaceae bacterium]
MAHHHTLARFALFTAAFALSGCKCSGSGPSPELAGVLNSYCKFMDRCPDSVEIPIAYRSTGECVDILNFVTTCRVDQVKGADGDRTPVLVKSNPMVDAAQADACKAYLDSASCSTKVLGCDSATDAGCNPCSSLFSPTTSSTGTTPKVGLDQKCDDSSNQCAAGLYCLGPRSTPDGGQTCRVCKPLRTLGGDCVDPPHVPCGPGLFCNTTTGACAGLLASGATCQQWGDCQSGFCNFGTMACDPGGKAGDACTKPGDCRNGYCDSTNHCADRQPNGGPCLSSADCQQSNCDPGTKTCGLPEGATCSSSGQCQGYCDSSGSRTCKSAAALGASCTDSDRCQSKYCHPSNKVCVKQCGQGCAAGEYCDSYGTCAAPKSDGSSCRDPEECQSGFCNDNDQCAKRPGIGDACAGYSDCSPKGLCSGGKCVAFAKPGEACTGLDSCAPPFLCTKGTCQLISLTCEPAKLGDQCTWLQVCDAQGYCNVLNSFTCEAKKASGASCLRSVECTSGLYCGNRTCTTYATEGATCNRETVCAAGLFCDSSSSPSKCAKPKAVGEKCSNPTDCQSGDCQYLSTLGQVCVAQCIAVPPGDQPACHPAKCTDQNATCGTIDGGCGEPVYCGQCTKAYETCGGGGQPLQCGCTPTRSCGPRECGFSMDDGCGHQVMCNATCGDGGTCGGAAGGGQSTNFCGCPSDRVAGPSLGALAATSRVGLRDGGTYAAWTSLAAVAQRDDAGTSVSLPGATGLRTESEWLVVSGFGFNLPPTASVNGITAKVRSRGEGNGSADLMEVVPFLDGKPIGKATSGYTLQPDWASPTFGGSSFLFGHGFSPTEINAPGFGLGVRASNTGSQSAVGFVDSIEVTVEYAYRCDCHYQCKSNSECGDDGCGGLCGALGTADGGCAGDAGVCSNGYCHPGVFVDSARGLMWLNEQFDRGSCSGLSIAGYSDWRVPTIDELRTRIVGCPATGPGGACAVSTTCTDAGTCLTPACNGCGYRTGPDPYGCYLDNHTEWIACTGSSPFFSSTKDGTVPYAVDFGTGRVSLAAGMTRYRCVRP